MKKRLFAILLALTLALSLLPVAVFATEVEDGAAEQQEQQQEQELPEETPEAQPADEEQPENGGTPDADKPAEPTVQSDEAGIVVQAAHTHCFCGGSVTAGDHTSHSDVTYTAWNGTSSISYTNNTAYVYLTGNATISSHLTVDGKTLYLCLNGKTLSSNGKAKIQVKNGGHLVLCDCQGGGTFKGATKNVWGGACVYLYASTLDMFGGKLTGGKVTGSGGGGAIAMDDQQCIFNMYGGEISGNNGRNYGGAIYRKFNANMPNTTGGTFNMYGGVIKNNTAKNGGAYFSTTGGTINMTGGTISGNKATQSDNNAGGGAIYLRGSGTINISGNAEITGNSSSLDGGAILMGWGAINISGSVKINNNAASRWGGAICLRQDSNQVTALYMQGGEISGNKASQEGGAIHAVDKDCLFFLYDGKITGNTSKDGGAIYLNQEPSALYMNGGEISGNTATGNGGGVYIYRSGSVCELYGGKIENNKASGNGGGIYINPSNNGLLRVGNTAVVKGNTVSGKANNVYLPSGKTLVIGIGMTPPDAAIGITTANTSYPVAFSNAYDKKNYAECFFADDVNAHVEYKDDHKLYLVSGAVARPLTVTFDPNGGTLADADKTKSLMTGDTYGTLPVPSYAGYDFAGWYTEKTSGTKIESDTTVTVAGTQTLYAHWTPIHVHAFTVQTKNDKTLKTPADCTNDAVYYLSCECGEISKTDTFTAENTALDHDWNAWAPNGNFTHTRTCSRNTSHTETGRCSFSEATCIAKAKCNVCNAESGETNPNNHAGTLGEWQSDENNHWKEYSCCGVRAEEGHHVWNNGTVTKQSTCTNAGEKTFTCTGCGKIKTERIDATGHNWKQEWKSDETHHWHECANGCDEKGDYAEHTGGEATCTAKAVCKVCNQAYGALKAHDFTAEKVEEQYLKSAATCTEKAVYYKSCTVCGEKGTETFEYGNALEHDYGAWASNGDGTHTRVCSRDKNHTESDKCSGGTATCTAKAVCEVCKEAYGDLALDKHDGGTELKNAKAATCTEKGYTGDTYCKGCNAKLADGKDIPAAGHKLKHVPAKNPTTFVAGNIEYWYCTVCGKYFRDAAGTQEITKESTVTHKESAPAQDNKTIKSSKTGDAGVMLYAGMAVLSLTGCAWLRRKEK